MLLPEMSSCRLCPGRVLLLSTSLSFPLLCPETEVFLNKYNDIYLSSYLYPDACCRLITGLINFSTLAQNDGPVGHHDPQ